MLPTSCREWPRYCRKAYWTKMVQNGPNEHFGQNDLIPNWILAFARPKLVHFGPFWPEEAHFGPFRSANRTLSIPDLVRRRFGRFLGIMWETLHFGGRRFLRSLLCAYPDTDRPRVALA